MEFSLTNLTKNGDDNKRNVEKTSVSPPTKVISVKHHFTIADHNEMLSLAQEKFDDLRKKSRERAATMRYSGSASKIRRRSIESQEERKMCQLLSSLLYLSLMMHKVDDMKNIFEANSGTLYNEWQTLFESLHSPVFHLRERCMQNEKVKKIYDRKQKYKAMFEETKASMTKLEESSKELGHALSIMSEENLKSQAMLTEKADVKLELCSAQAKVEQLLGTVQRQEENISFTNETRVKLVSSLGVAEKQVWKLEQKVQNDETLAFKAATDIVDLSRDVKDLRERLQNKEQELLLSKKEGEHFQNTLQQQAIERNLLLGEKDNLLIERRESNDRLQSVINSLQNEKTELESSFSSKTNVLQSSSSNMTMELGIMTVKFQTSQEEAANLRSELKSKCNVLESALKLNSSAQLSQSELRKMIDSQQKDIRQLNEMRQSVDLKFAEASSQLQVKAGEHNAIRVQLDREKVELEAKVAVQKQRIRLLEDGISTASALELKRTNEKYLLETTLSEISMESKAYLAERNMLEKVLEKMKDTMEKSIHIASQSKENVDAKMKETETDLVSVQMELVKGQAENDIMKAKISTQQNRSEILEAKVVASEEKSAVLLEETIEKDNVEKHKLSNEINAIKGRCVEEVRVAKERQVIAELKVKEIELASDDKIAKLLHEIALKHNEEKEDNVNKVMKLFKVDDMEVAREAKEKQAVAESKVKAIELEMGNKSYTPEFGDCEIMPSLSSEKTYAKKIVTEAMSSAVDIAFCQSK